VLVLRRYRFDRARHGRNLALFSIFPMNMPSLSPLLAAFFFFFFCRACALLIFFGGGW
jgi:hypothetical protein